MVLVHGVGIGPWSYAELAPSLARDHLVIVPHRRGYGSSAAMAAASSLDEQVDDLAGLVDGPTGFVGVSGGATLVLALALSHPGLVAAAFYLIVACVSGAGTASGTVKRNRLPAPRLGSTQMAPPRRSTIRLQMARPIPVPL